MTSQYDRMVRCFIHPPAERPRRDLLELESWFRKKSKLLKTLNQETLLDVIQHCEFVTRQKDDVIIHQGEKGHRLYILLRGSVSVLQKESLEDVDLGDEGQNTKVDRATLGNHLVTLREGTIFGEIALINPDCIRTASIVVEERSDLVVIHRDLYNRSISKVVAREYQEKIDFIESLPLIQKWMPKFRKQLAASFKREVFPFDGVLFKQGEPVSDLYFIVKGEVKLVVDPEAHFQQFDKFMKRCGNVLEGAESGIQSESAYFPQKFLPQLAKYSRVNKAAMLKRPESSAGSTSGASQRQLPRSWSPSAIRRMNHQINSKKVNISLCYLGEKQCLGDVEALLGLDVYHATAVCSQETTVMMLQRNHFERLFRKRNATTVKEMAQLLELQLTRRVLKPNIVDSAPLLKCFVYKLQQVYGDRAQDRDGLEATGGAFVLPEVVYDDRNRTTGNGTVPPHRGQERNYTWSMAVGGPHPPPRSPRSQFNDGLGTRGSDRTIVGEDFISNISHVTAR